MAPKSKNNVPIMRVYTQPQGAQPVTEFSSNTFKAISAEATPSNESISSSSTESNLTPTESKPFKFFTHQFHEGKPITLRPPSSGSTRRRPPPPSESALPPPAKRRRKEPVRRKTYLSVFKPLQNADQVHKDIWEIVLGFSHPRTLLDARYIDTVRYSILSQHTKIWKDSRLLHLGDDCPPCPARLTEQQYVDLLVGRGCQIRSCPNRDTYFVSWPFLGRLCKDCLLQRTIKSDTLPNHRQYLLSNSRYLWDALPMAQYTSRRYGPPRRMRPDATDWLQPGGSHLILRSDYDKLEKEYLDLKLVQTPDPEILKWWQNRKDETLRHMAEMEAILAWKSKVRTDRRTESVTPSLARRQFFEEKAAEMDPPMSKEVLDRMTAFHRALRSYNPPTDLAWDILYEKIRPHLETVVKIFGDKSETADSDPQRDESSVAPGLMIELQVKRHRAGIWTTTYNQSRPELKFVLKLADSEYNKCVESGASDHNLVLMCLKNVYERYEKMAEADRPEGMNWDGTKGSYVLSMDDARLIVQKMAKFEADSDWDRRERIFSSFKCPVCWEYQRLMSFETCLKHIFIKHCHTVGDEGEFWRLYLYRPGLVQDFPYHTTPWPRCMPLLPAYCDAKMVRPWNPNTEMDFMRDEEEEVEKKSAFEDRVAAWDGEELPTFMEILEKALQAMERVTLKSKFVVKVALKYAMEVSRETGIEIPSLEEFMEEHPGLESRYPTVSWNFKCQSCLRELEDVPKKRPVKFEIDIKKLYDHWKEQHAIYPNQEWTRDFMRLPSDEELYTELRECDELLQKEKDKITNFDPGDAFRKRQNPKAPVILEKQFAMEVFDELFPLIDSEASPRRSRFNGSEEQEQEGQKD